MVSQAKLIKQGIYLTDSLFDEIIRRLAKGIQTSDTLEDFLNKTKEYTMNNPLVVTGYKDKLLEIILQETNNHKFSRPAQKELTRLTIENRVGDLIVDVGEDIKYNVRDIVKNGYNNKLSQDEIAENITKKITTIKNKRARAIARTEIVRTATASDYVINKERGANAFTVDCRNTACDYCKQKVLKNPEREATGKGMTGDVEFGIDDVENLPPFHPNCRCVAMFFKKEDDNPDNAVGINEDMYNSKSNDDSSSFFDKYKAPDGAKPIVLSERIIEKELNGFADSEDIPTLLKLFKKFNNTTEDCDYEWIIGRTNKGRSPESARTDNSKTYVYLHDSLQNLKSPERLLVVVHNHIWGMTPLYSEKDLGLYLTNNIKYGVTTNEKGLLILRNNNKIKLSDEDIKNLKKRVADTDTTLVERFNEDKNMSFDSENDDHKYLLNEYLKDNFEEWVDEYVAILSDYDIKVKFINAKNYNID